MAQIFQPYFVLTLKLGFLAAVLLIVAVILAWRVHTGPPVAVGAPVEQPIPFSHKHHVGDDGIDCRYCHTSVERSSFAGLPQTEICMTCHSQLFKDAPVLAPLFQSFETGKPLHWNRVHDLPDFVYFNHSIHVNKGIGCASCHGEVDQMPLTWRTQSLEMQWCLSCHREPERYIRPREQVFNLHWQPSEAEQAVLGPLLVKQYHVQKERITDCSICHR
jgi:Cytochrome c7 and related cytochrome c